MHVFVTGATGFIGSYVLRQLQAHGHTVRCLVRSLTPRGVDAVRGDVTQAASLRGTMDGCDAVIHLVGIIDEITDRGITFEALHTGATRNVVQEAQRAGVERFVQISANGAASDGVSRYQTTKWQAEAVVRAAGFRHWTILRPGVVFGEPPPGTTEFCTRLARELILPLPVLPLFGKGAFRIQPISVEELAEALVQGLQREEAHGRTLIAVGQQSLTFRDVVDCITKGLGRKPKPKVSVPAGLARRGIRWLAPLGIMPLSVDQFEMLTGGNVGDPGPFYQAFDLQPVPFVPKNLSYLRRRA